MNYLYRYDDYQDAFGRAHVMLDRYPIIKHTPCGRWVDIGFGKKWVSIAAYRRWACETIEEAAKSFKARKAKQVRILKSQLARAEDALKQATEGRLDNTFSETSIK